MYNFENILMKDEQILYQCRPSITKGSKNIFGELFVFGFMTLIQFLVVKFGDNNIIISIIFFAVTILFQGLVTYAACYKLFFRKKKISDDFYCITNLRAMKYDANDDVLSYGFLANYSKFQINNFKDGYGDLYMEIICDDDIEAETVRKNISEMVNLLKKPNLTNMPFMKFESIENPKKVEEIIKNAKKNIDNIEKFSIDNIGDFISK